MLEKERNTIAGLEFSKIALLLSGGQNLSINSDVWTKWRIEKIQIVTGPVAGDTGTAYLDQVWEITFATGSR